MSVVLITMWIMANGDVATQTVEMASLDACHQAKSIVVESTELILRDDGYLKDVDVACKERGDGTYTLPLGLPPMRRIRD